MPFLPFSNRILTSYLLFFPPSSSPASFLQVHGLSVHVRPWRICAMDEKFHHLCDCRVCMCPCHQCGHPGSTPRTCLLQIRPEALHSLYPSVVQSTVLLLEEGSLLSASSRSYSSLVFGFEVPFHGICDSAPYCRKHRSMAGNVPSQIRENLVNGRESVHIFILKCGFD